MCVGFWRGMFLLWRIEEVEEEEEVCEEAVMQIDRSWM